MNTAERLADLSHRLETFEIVPGLVLPAPRFVRSWSGSSFVVEGSALPRSFVEFVENPGAILAMDTAGGVAFLAPSDVEEHLSQDYGDLLRKVDEVPTFPFAVNGSGSYLLLALDDSAVWKFNAHMHPVARPIRIADGFKDFLKHVSADWEAVLNGRGAPYSTS